MARIIVVALGSNDGPREQHLQYAIARLGDLLGDMRVSSFIETIPVDVPPQPDFLNAVATGSSEVDSQALLKCLLSIEAERGRIRLQDGSPRTLDLDLVLAGNEILRTEALTLPHPRFRERRFVLEPLCEIAPETQDPLSGLSARELLAKI